MECQDFKPNGAGQATMLFGATVRAETLRLAGKCYDVPIDAGGRYLLGPPKTPRGRQAAGKRLQGANSALVEGDTAAQSGRKPRYRTRHGDWIPPGAGKNSCRSGSGSG